MTQKEAIIMALKKSPKRGMSDREMVNLGIGRPSARISELRQLGYRFNVTVERAKNILGGTSTFYRYTLAGEPNG